MKFTAIKTPIVKEHDDLFEIITDSIEKIPEKSVLIVTSKILSYAQGRLVEKELGTKQEKHQLVKQEADYYLPSSYSKYDMMLAIKNHTLTVNAGVDESNAAGKYVLWPKNMQQEINQLWKKLREFYKVKQLGIILTDSRTWPFRWGVVGTALVHCGFKQLADQRGEKDLFGRKIKMVQLNVAEAIASASSLEMGEVAEQTPLCIVENIKHIEFQNRPPTKKELEDLKIEKENDAYGPLLINADWRKAK